MTNLNKQSVLFFVAAVFVTGVAVFALASPVAAYVTSGGGTGCTDCGSSSSSSSSSSTSSGGNDEVNPSCYIRASKDTITKGKSVTLTWDSYQARKATLNGESGLGKSGQKVVSPSETTTYTLRVTSRTNDHKVCRVTVTVKDPQPKKPQCTISISDRTPEYGGNTTISWTSKRADKVRLSSVGLVSNNGSHTFTNITSSQTYTITVIGKDGSKETCKKTVNPDPKPKNPKCTISVNHPNPNYGGNAKITWTSQNAKKVHLSSVGNVSDSGSHTFQNITSTRTYTITVTGKDNSVKTCTETVVPKQQEQNPYCTINANPSSVAYGASSNLTWTSTNANSASIDYIGSVSLNGSQSTGSLYGTRTYTMTVYSNSGKTATCQTTVYTGDQSQPICNIYANPSSISEGGNTTLSWSSSNATSASIDALGSVSLNGSQTVYPGYSRTYVMTVWGSNGQSNTCTTSVNINTQNNLWCTISVQPQYVSHNGTAQLTWSSVGATNAWISDIGSVSTNGSTTVHPNGAKTYTMTISNGYDTETCTTTVNAYMGGTTYVSLTQIPYTGFDFGVMGNAIYWVLLMSGAVAAGYVLTVYRGGVLAFVSNPFLASSDEGAEEDEDTDETPEAEVSEDYETANGVMSIVQDGGTPRIVIRG